METGKDLTNTPEPRFGVLKINTKILQQLLKLPKDVKFVKVRQDWRGEREGSFEILVEAPNLKESNPGEPIPEVKCVIHTHFCNETEESHITQGEVSNW